MTKMSLSSKVLTDSHKFLSKDGFYYATYTDYVAANVSHNQKILKEKGLDEQSLRKIRTSVTTIQAKKRRANIHSSTIREQQKDHLNQLEFSSSRRSTRLQKKLRGDTIDSKDDNENNLDPSEYDSSLVEADGTFRKSKVLGNGRKKLLKRSQTTTTTDSHMVLSANELEQLRCVPNEVWVTQMDEYLHRIEQISIPNRQSVMRQIQKLVDGTGISYKHWPDDITYEHDSYWTLGTDTVAKYEEAIRYENEYGRDLGNGNFILFFVCKIIMIFCYCGFLSYRCNFIFFCCVYKFFLVCNTGWLLRHPITKLMNFQSYYLSNLLLKNKDDIDRALVDDNSEKASSARPTGNSM